MKIFRKYISLLVAAMLIMGIAVTVYADGTVRYAGNSGEFVFEPGSDLSATDLFDGFKGVMPGDTIANRITIRNDASKEVKIKLYLRSLGAQEATDEFLNQMKLTVKQEGDSILFQAPADETAQLGDWVYLGTFYSGADIDLLLTLEVPIEMGNDFQKAVGMIDWEFGVEEFPVEIGDPAVPNTSDNRQAFLYVGLMILGIAGVAVLTTTHTYCKNAKNNEK